MRKEGTTATYIDVINGFYSCVENMNADGITISSSEIALWMALANVWNRLRRKNDWFAVTNAELSRLSGMSHQTINRVRNSLAMKGLLQFVQHANRKATRYCVTTIKVATAKAVVKMAEEKEKAEEEKEILKPDAESEQTPVAPSGSQWPPVGPSGPQSDPVVTKSKMDTRYVQNGHNHRDTEKEKLSNESKEKSHTTNRPTETDITDYCKEASISIDAGRFVDYYSSIGWMIGKAPMIDWKAAVRCWARRDAKYAAIPKKTTVPKGCGINAGYHQTPLSDAELDALEAELDILSRPDAMLAMA